MITLVQFHWCPFCLVQRRILEYAGARYKIVNIPCTDRSLVWRWSRQRYYQVPIIKDGKYVIFETDEDSQVIAKYIDAKYELGLFPKEWAGLQGILWRHIENEIEGLAFKLNDVYYQEYVPTREWLAFLQHKERKFGRGCIERWRQQQLALMEALVNHLLPFEQMLATRPYLLDQHPRFVDFDLYGMLGNYLFSGHYQLPAAHSRLQQWYDRLTHATRAK